jgi:hypothetical protein
MPPIRFQGKRWHFEMEHMKHSLAIANDRRERPRFSIDAPLTVTVRDVEISGYTRDLTNRGVYFCLALADGTVLDREIEFEVDLPSEITLSTLCRIQCRGRVVRTEKTSKNLTGIAVEILDYSIKKESVAGS